MIGTIEIKEASDIRQAVDRLVEAYVELGPHGRFSYRILLPRDEKSTAKAKRIGLSFQGELVLGLRKRNIVPKMRDVRYVHDANHYGWLLASPGVYDQFGKG